MRTVPAVWPAARRLVAVCSVLIATIAFSASKASAFEPSVPESFFGISDPGLWALTEQRNWTQRDAQLQQIKAARLDWVRSEVGWREIEYEAPQGDWHRYDWSLADNYVTALARQGLELFPMVMSAPAWAQDPAAIAGACGRRGAVAPDHAGDYGDFAAALVRRYGADGRLWASNPSLPYRPVTRVELWNEPNSRGFWCPAPDPETFASLMRQGADSIHAADPSVEVVLGGLAAFKTTQSDGGGLVGIGAGEFLGRMLTRDPALASRIDTVAFHPYELDPNVDLFLIDWLRQQMNAVGLGAAGIALTEFGWHGGTAPGALSEEQRAQNYLQFTDQIARTDCGITGVAAHTWQTPELNPANQEDWWGIASPSTGELYPSGHAYRDVVALYEGGGPTPAPSATISLCGDPGVVTIDSGPANSELAGPTPRFTFSAPYASSFECRFDGDAFAPCSATGAPATALADGDHAFEVRAISWSGKVGASTTRAFTVDATPPDVKVFMAGRTASGKGAGPRRIRSRSVGFKFVASDSSPVGSYACKLDGRAWHACRSQLRLWHLSYGRHALRVRLSDKWGNSATTTAVWRVVPRL